MRAPCLIAILPPPGTEPAPAFAHLLAGDGPDTPLRHGLPTRSLVAPLSAGTETCAVVPAQALTWHRVSLPQAISRSLLSRHADPARARAVLTGLLEEQLLEEPESLHFAIFPGQQPQDPVWVAVCARAWLQHALRSLEATGLRVARIVPELAPAASASLPTALHVCGTEEVPHLQLSTATGACCLPWCRATTSLAAALPDTQITAEPAVLALAAQAFNRPVERQTAAAHHLQAAAADWNLAQFDLAPSWRVRWLKPLTHGWQAFALAPRWRALRWGLGLLVLTHAVGIGAWAWQENAELARKRAAIAGILLQTFPETGLVVDAPLQMQRSIEMLQQASGRDPAPALDRVLAAVRQANPAYAPLQGIDLVRGEFRLRGPHLEAEPAQEMLQRLQEFGLAAHVEDGLLVIRRGEHP